MNVKTKLFYCVSTHWDREWYEPFQEYRMWLIESIDALLDLMEQHEEFRHFHLDGQACVLKDYLALRPENKDRLVKLLKEGRILAGPWHVLPDEWLISSESYIRNLMLGMHTCREFGFEPMRFGYTPDQFGHIAALPTIMMGMGMKGGICWRGTTDEDYPPQFIWVGPDGTRMVTHKLFDRAAYGTIFERARDCRASGTQEGVQEFEDLMRKYIDHDLGRIGIPAMLVMDGQDHQHPSERMIGTFEYMQETYPDLECIWGTLEQYIEEVARHEDQLEERTGELRMPRRKSECAQYLIVHVLSSRYDLKKANTEGEALLEKWVEPCALFEAMEGGEPLLSAIDLAWEYLILNHPHDSICGCSIDQVHRDMIYRFDQSRMLGEGVLRRSLSRLGGGHEPELVPQPVVVHNSLPFPRREVVELEISFPRQWPHSFREGLVTNEDINTFELVDAEGRELPFQICRIDRNVTHQRPDSTRRRWPRNSDVYTLAVEMDLPPCGFTGFEIRPVRKGLRNWGSLRDGHLSAANEHLRFVLNPDGTAALEDRATGRTYDGLFQYEDRADAGDGWTFGPITNDRTFVTPGTRVTTGIDEDGPLRVVFRAEREIELPPALVPHEWNREEGRTTLRIVDRFIVEKDAPYIRVVTRIENTVKDHRLRVLFPTGLDVEKSFAETPFALVERGVDPPAESKDWHEKVNPETAFTTYFGTADAQGGLAVISGCGLHEYEVTQRPRGTLALTLLRSFFRTVQTNGEPDGQLQQPLEYEYLLHPFAGPFDPVAAWRLASANQAKVRWHYSEAVSENRSFAHVAPGNAVVSAIKPAAWQAGGPITRGVVRLWNPTDQPLEETIHFDQPIAEAWACNLAEDPGDPIPLTQEGAIPVTVPPRGLASVLFRWEGG